MVGATVLQRFFFILLIEASNLRNKEMRKAGQEKKDKNAFTAKNGGVKSRRMEKKIQTSLDLENIRLFVSAWTVPDIQASDADYKYWWEKKIFCQSILNVPAIRFQEFSHGTRSWN